MSFIFRHKVAFHARPLQGWKSTWFDRVTLDVRPCLSCPSNTKCSSRRQRHATMYLDVRRFYVRPCTVTFDQHTILRETIQGSSHAAPDNGRRPLRGRVIEGGHRTRVAHCPSLPDGWRIPAIDEKKIFRVVCSTMSRPRTYLQKMSNAQVPTWCCTELGGPLGRNTLYVPVSSNPLSSS